MCSGEAPELEKESSFVGRWMDILRPGYEKVKDIDDRTERLRALEQQAILTSLENLMTFPFVRNSVENETLSIHGLWNDIGEGDLYYCDGDGFTPVT